MILLFQHEDFSYFQLQCLCVIKGQTNSIQSINLTLTITFISTITTTYNQGFS